MNILWQVILIIKYSKPLIMINIANGAKHYNWMEDHAHADDDPTCGIDTDWLLLRAIMPKAYVEKHYMPRPRLWTDGDKLEVTISKELKVM